MEDILAVNYLKEWLTTHTTQSLFTYLEGRAQSVITAKLISGKFVFCIPIKCSRINRTTLFLSHDKILCEQMESTTCNL